MKIRRGIDFFVGALSDNAFCAKSIDFFAGVLSNRVLLPWLQKATEDFLIFDLA